MERAGEDGRPESLTDEPGGHQRHGRGNITPEVGGVEDEEEDRDDAVQRPGEAHGHWMK